ncbi:cupin domain-containing protein [Bordetella sp. FB-8]|uniref:cupin domain-containing protein n=1 Tax=Bordetella sp. FB-8 TaxID=1159870 RepID=UPI00037D08F3|nr:cupin domain-containing protein [Bordetella sp. FB-8]
MPITILSQSATISDLQDLGDLASSLSAIPCRTRDLPVDLEGAGGSSMGVWECTPGQSRRQVAGAEVMHILTGACSFTPEGGEPREIRAGDTLFFPANTRGIWNIQETLRKVYVIFS